MPDGTVAADGLEADDRLLVGEHSEDAVREIDRRRSLGQ
jgi:hypothetical protein